MYYINDLDSQMTILKCKYIYLRVCVCVCALLCNVQPKPLSPSLKATQELKIFMKEKLRLLRVPGILCHGIDWIHQKEQSRQSRTSMGKPLLRAPGPGLSRTHMSEQVC